MAVSNLPPAIIEVMYAEYAREYLRSLPPEHFMEATPQATQRQITLASLALVVARRPDFHLFNELLVQYRREGQKRPGQVVPDNMVVIHDGRIRADGSYDVPIQPGPPFWVLEYVSKSSRRKDYDDNFDKYEKELLVPYYLVFYPETQDLDLFRLVGGKYQAIVPDEQGRRALPELHIEVALVDGWVRFWYQGQLLPLPADLQRDLGEARQELGQAQEQLGQAQEQLGQAQERTINLERQLERERADRQALQDELARLRAQLGGGQPGGEEG